MTLRRSSSAPLARLFSEKQLSYHVVAKYASYFILSHVANKVFPLKVVNDSAVRQELLSSGLVCPICGTENISPDSVSYSVVKKSIILQLFERCVSVAPRSERSS